MEHLHVVDEVPDLPAGQPVPLVVALQGFLDAGNASALAVAELTRHDPGRVVATFDVDVFHDYRARRPMVTFNRDHYQDYDAPRLVVRLVRDAADQPYLLLTGPEPDTRWEAFSRGVRELVERFDVELVVSLASVPMAAPHTRPLAVTQHANDEDLLSRENPWVGEIRVPSSASALLEIRLGDHGHPMTGFVAHVPHYVAQGDYPMATLSLLEDLAAATGLEIDLDPVRDATAAKAREIDDYIAEHGEVAELVRGLEQQYDAFTRSEEAGSSLLAEDAPLPSGEELGAQFERFLAGLDGPEGTDPRGFGDHQG
ncbi:PAC2 family protein [Nocardioides sp. AE5]|uniref:PAC2 family protein n=1 Tax=Nocardioides sp. AE5 TaxID=2962573 RepID=UPI002882A0B9|nr:PAC2 family protein [Nocardioides sp. AE5]MDT0201401.1 PAC2 family protein [Nocardioides sp. AE5]